MLWQYLQEKLHTQERAQDVQQFGSSTRPHLQLVPNAASSQQRIRLAQTAVCIRADRLLQRKKINLYL